MAFVTCADAIFMSAGTKDDKVTVKTDKEVDFAKISIEDAFKELKVLLRLQNVLEPLSIFCSSLQWITAEHSTCTLMAFAPASIQRLQAGVLRPSAANVVATQIPGTMMRWVCCMAVHRGGFD